MAQTIYGAVLTDTILLTATTPLTMPVAAGPDSTQSLKRAVALPFTPAGMEHEQEVARQRNAADYLTPRTVSAPRMRVDPHPQRLLIPAIGVDTVVQEVFIADGVWQVADYAAGYHHGSALPGETGNVVMAGHAGLRGAVFRDLGTLAPGDVVLVDAGTWRHHYQVRQRLSVWPTQIEVMEPTPTPVLTLITCTAWDTQRLVVIADLIDSRPL